MSDYTDFVETYCRTPFTDYAEAQLELTELEQWKRNYESKRDKYPEWVTKTGQKIKVRDLTDSHIENLLKFIPKKDPNNETKWLDVIKCEKQYRNINNEIVSKKNEINHLSRELDRLDDIY